VTTETREPSAARLAGLRLSARSLEVPAFHLGGTLTLPPRDRLRTAGASVTDVMVLAAGVALSSTPRVNMTLGAGEPVPRPGLRVGWLAREQDALVPLSLPYQHGETPRALRRRREQTLMRYRDTRALRADCSVMVSNLGAQGVEWFTALPFPGVAVMVAVGAARETTPGGQETAVTLTCDHRIIDGIDAAQYFSSLSRSCQQIALF
jgi:pyruvate dehydrogenase E2 component (dihydrolipoamide acetyltransferase)